MKKEEEKAYSILQIIIMIVLYLSGNFMSWDIAMVMGFGMVTGLIFRVIQKLKEIQK